MKNISQIEHSRHRSPVNCDELTSEIEFHIRQLTKPMIASLTGWDSILDALYVSGIF